MSLQNVLLCLLQALNMGKVNEPSERTTSFTTGFEEGKSLPQDKSDQERPQKHRPSEEELFQDVRKHTPKHTAGIRSKRNIRRNILANTQAKTNIPTIYKHIYIYKFIYIYSKIK